MEAEEKVKIDKSRGKTLFDEILEREANKGKKVEGSSKYTPEMVKI